MFLLTSFRLSLGQTRFSEIVLRILHSLNLVNLYGTPPQSGSNGFPDQSASHLREIVEGPSLVEEVGGNGFTLRGETFRLGHCG